MQELGQSSGFDVEMEDRGNLGHDGLMKARAQFMQLASKDPLLAAVRPNGLDDTAQLHIDIDQDKASALGVSIANINATLSAAWGGLYVNDFIDRGRVKRVYMQADAPIACLPGRSLPLRMSRGAASGGYRRRSPPSVPSNGP